ncbi:unnamed protein product [Calicophoron daubneyi]|uniref:Peptidase S1 domain-containing protein n=1 Tax=Calicophoron daubneyi TaxID=300641 RepID=A0AAV2TQ74_CALDB
MRLPHIGVFILLCLLAFPAVLSKGRSRGCGCGRRYYSQNPSNSPYPYNQGEERENKFINIGIWQAGPAKPEKLIVFNDERYGNWSEWSECLVKECVQIRSRQCLDDSWKTPALDKVHTSQCLSKYYAEKRNCTDKSKCTTQIGAQMIESLTETCGIRPNTQAVMEKILGGKVTKPNSWPWAVRLSVKPPGNKPITFCGGTLIAPQWVLTAAHCVLIENKRMPVGRPVKLADHMKSIIYAHLGDHHLQKKEKTQIDRRVTTAILHPKYHRKLMTDGDDIALLYLDKPVNVSTNVSYACLPSKDLRIPPGTKCYALGWGSDQGGHAPTFDNIQSIFDSLFVSFPGFFDTHFPFSRPMFSKRRRPSRRATTVNELQEVELPIVSVDSCRRHYAEINEDVHICAGSKGKDTCAGDSGGGLYCVLPKSDRWFVVGVTSFGLARGCGLNPGVYTSVGAHLDWISSTLARPTQ